jgi:hypothetical protein
LEAVLKTHPEGTLWYFHGVLLVKQGRYVEAEQSFWRATTTPALLNVKRPALQGVALATGWQLSPWRERRPDPDVRRRAIQAVEQLAQGPIRDSDGELLVSVAIHAGAFDLGRFLLAKWEQGSPGSKPLLLRVGLERAAGDHQATLVAADRYLTQAPGDKLVTDIRANARKQLEAFLKARP